MRYRLLVALACVMVLAVGPGSAQPPPADTAGAPTEQRQAAEATAAESRAAESKAAEQAALAASLAGPRDIPLADQATLHLPADHLWVPRDEAERLIRAWGNATDPTRLGLIVGPGTEERQVATVAYVPAGHVTDDDARDLDPATLLAALRTRNEEENKQRVAGGFAPVATQDWLQAPRYDAARKRLVWALPLLPEGVDAERATINFNTRALGREGFIGLDLLTTRAQFEATKPEAESLLADIEYLPGRRYSDFSASTDHVAAYGLAGLIGVVALKKLGIIALGTAFVLKFAKLGVLLVLGAVALLRRTVFGHGRGNTGA